MQICTSLIWKLSILQMKDGRTGQQTAIILLRSVSISVLSGSALVLFCLLSVLSGFQFKHFLREGQTTYNRFESNDNRFAF